MLREPRRKMVERWAKLLTPREICPEFVEDPKRVIPPPGHFERKTKQACPKVPTGAAPHTRLW